MAATRVLLPAGLLLSAQGVAFACPFCGGKGASGLLENLLLVVGVLLGARALMRAMRRRRARERPPEPEATTRR